MESGGGGVGVDGGVDQLLQSPVVDPSSVFKFPADSSSLGLLLVVSVAMMIAPTIGYFPQYAAIKEAASPKGFSPFVCFFLLMANLLRLLFWLGKRFELTLVLQSVFMIGLQLWLLELCVRLKKRSPDTPLRRFREYPMEEFWNWDDFSSYLEFLALTMGLAGLLTWLMSEVLHSMVFVELLGVASVTFEAFLGVPQLVRNHQTHSTSGLRWELVLTWFIGDLFKTTYFIVMQLPLQFLFCGVFQFAVDVIIVLQIALFSPTKLSCRRYFESCCGAGSSTSTGNGSSSAASHSATSATAAATTAANSGAATATLSAKEAASSTGIAAADLAAVSPEDHAESERSVEKETSSAAASLLLSTRSLFQPRKVASE